MRRPTLKEIAQEALRKAKEAQGDCQALSSQVARANSAMRGILDKLAAFLKWAQAYGWDANDPFQKRTLDLVRDLQDEALKAFVEDGGHSKP